MGTSSKGVVVSRATVLPISSQSSVRSQLSITTTSLSVVVVDVGVVDVVVEEVVDVVSHRS